MGMKRPGGRSILSEIGRQLIEMVEDASRDMNQPPFGRPDAAPRPRPPWETPPLEESAPLEAGPDEEAVTTASRRRERAPAPPPLRADRSIRSQLRSKAGVRRALVLNEILGPPKSMSNDDFR